jgi:nitrite reductase/ring-hydroxylating ferredoxin subunit
MTTDDHQTTPRSGAPADAQADAGSQCPFHRWREDFPIQWEMDHYVTRRELAKFLTLGSGLLMGANAVIAGIGLLARAAATPRVHIGQASAVPAGGSFLFRYPTDDDPCILVREQDGALRAYSQVCTHLACAVIFKPEEDTLFCPCHHGVFSVSEGRPIAGPPTRRLPRIKLEQRGDEIFAVGVEV